jgi:hypothetical protein
MPTKDLYQFLEDVSDFCQGARDGTDHGLTSICPGYEHDGLVDLVRHFESLWVACLTRRNRGLPWGVQGNAVDP